MNHNCVCGHPPSNHARNHGPCDFDGIDPCTCPCFELDSDD